MRFSPTLLGNLDGPGFHLVLDVLIVRTQVRPLSPHGVAAAPNTLYQKISSLGFYGFLS
jgi:hypothetical protein